MSFHRCGFFIGFLLHVCHFGHVLVFSPIPGRARTLSQEREEELMPAYLRKDVDYEVAFDANIVSFSDSIDRT